MQAVQTQTFLFLPLPPSQIPLRCPLPSAPLLLLLCEVKAHLPTKGLWGHASACEMWTRWHSRAALSRAVLLFTRVPVSGLTSPVKGRQGERVVYYGCPLQPSVFTNAKVGEKESLKVFQNGNTGTFYTTTPKCYHELAVTPNDVALDMLRW